MPRDYSSEYKGYQGTKEQKKKRALRNKARRKMIKEGKAKVGDGKDVAHLDDNVKNNSSKNLRMQPKSKNRSFPRNKKSGHKKK